MTQFLKHQRQALAYVCCADRAEHAGIREALCRRLRSKGLGITEPGQVKASLAETCIACSYTSNVLTQLD